MSATTYNAGQTENRQFDAVIYPTQTKTKTKMPQIPPPSLDADIETAPKNRAAQFLRVLGAAAVCLSGLIYLFQGLNEVETVLRYWVYLALMFCLGIGGIFSHKFMDDNKGARLFFALAVLIIPVQFSQLGSMTFNYIGYNASQLLAFTALPAASLGILCIVAVTSLVLASLLSYAGFSILSRPYAKTLTLSYLAANLALALPFREIPLGLIPIFSALAILFYLNKKIAKDINLFNTREGIAVRFMQTLPLLIIIGRAFFYIDSALEFTLLTTTVTGLLYQLSQRLKYRNNPERLHGTDEKTSRNLTFEITLLITSLSAVLSSMGFYLFVSEELFSGYADTASFLFFYLVIGLFARTSHISNRFAGFYRIIALGIALLFTLNIGFEATILELCTLLLLGASAITWALSIKRKLPLVSGALILAIASTQWLWLTVNSVDVNAWVALAILGLGSVALSSLLEKQGKRWIQNSISRGRDLAQWSY